MLLDCVRNPRLTDTERLIWAIVICLAHLLGAVIYYFAGRRHSKPQNPSATR
jgi:membrane protein DedA with SNARE-associated domain